MKSKRFFTMLLCIIVIIFSVSNNRAVNTIDDSAYVVAIGFDSSENGKLNLSLQIAIPSSEVSSSSSSSEQSTSTIVNTVECDSIFSGITLINSYISKKLNLSYCKVAVFSEEFSKNGISNYVSTLINDIEVRPTCHVLISKCDAKYFLENSKPMLQSLSSKYYEIESSSEKNTGYTKAVTLLDFYNGYYDTFSQPYAILGNINGANPSDLENNQFSIGVNTQKKEKLNSVTSVESQDSNSTQRNIENLGLAVFNNDMLVGELSNSQTISHLVLSNQLSSTILNIPSPFSDIDVISLNVIKTNSKNNVQIINNTPYITCDVEFKTRIISSSIASNYLTKENIRLLEDYANSYIKAHLEEFLYKTSVEFKSDIVGFGKYAVRSFNTIHEWQNYNWLSKYENSFFEVNVDTTIMSSYLLLQDK